MTSVEPPAIAFDFWIEPFPKERPRSFLQRGQIITTTAPKTREYENSLRWMARNQYKAAPLEGPLAVEIEFQLARPPSVKRAYPSVKPDLDNLKKALLDSLNGIAWLDDAQIVSLSAVKTYALAPQGKIVMKVRTIA